MTLWDKYQNIIVAIVALTEEDTNLQGHTRRTDDTRRTGGDIEVHDDNTETMTLSVPSAMNRLTKPMDHLMQVVITNSHRVIITFIQAVLIHG